VKKSGPYKELMGLLGRLAQSLTKPTFSVATGLRSSGLGLVLPQKRRRFAIYARHHWQKSDKI
jgi:hypothetical protein